MGSLEVSPLALMISALSALTCSVLARPIRGLNLDVNACTWCLGLKGAPEMAATPVESTARLPRAIITVQSQRGSISADKAP